MGELRKDYLLDRWVYVAPSRGKRPHQVKGSEQPVEGVDFFAPGNEGLTPPEIGRIERDGKWQVRWFENKFAVLKPEGSPVLSTSGRFYSYGGNFGYHEVIVETPDNRQLAELNVDELELVFRAYSSRIVDLEKKPNISYVSVFKNHGYLGGTSIFHSHSQLIATCVIPPEVREKISAVRKFLQCPYCEVLSSERSSARFCFENDDFMAFTPFASRFNYELWVFPKLHHSRFEELNFSSLADLMSRALKKVHELGCGYNIMVFYAPKGDDLHVHIEICPRIAIWAGFEMASGIIINSVSPEDAAKFYRGEE